MPVLIDSDILIEVSRGRDAEILTRWRALASSGAVLLYSPVTVAELWHGARASEEDALDNLFAALLCAPIDQIIGRMAGQYLRQFRKSHNLELADALIAATAFANEAQLWTRNHKHYPMREIQLL